MLLFARRLEGAIISTLLTRGGADSRKVTTKFQQRHLLMRLWNAFGPEATNPGRDNAEPPPPSFTEGKRLHHAGNAATVP